MLNRDSIFASPDMPSETVHIPEWGGDVVVRGLTAAQRDSYEQSMLDKDQQPDLTNARAKLVVLCTVDDMGTPIFSDTDAEEIGKKSAAAVQRIVAVAQRLSGMAEAPEKK